MPDRLRFLGTEWYPRTDGTVSVLVESGDETLLVDCPPNVTMALDDLGVAPASIDALLLTHAHIDHVLGAPYLLSARFYETAGTIREGPTDAGPIEVFVERSTRPRLDELLSGAGVDLDATLGPEGYAVTAVEGGDSLSVGGTPVDLLPAAHAVPTLGLVIRGDRTVGYTCDTTYDEEFVAGLGTVDALVAEAAFASDRRALADDLGHATAAEAGRMAAATDAETLYLVHVADTYPDADRHRGEAAAEFDGRVVVPSAGDAVPLG